ncbi:hypothetical protein GWI33_001158 [Rhynchophorus ferrugineus]|uniref:Uncharacterized protein n=1 Tax=Rhynchophorus ferrugineus TaxID=354439 RepID=A0A834IQK5_RHYFE|nr:hypothetical protein GWI33_001158 [Rhynchophorus ferrugineus]
MTPGDILAPSDGNKVKAVRSGSGLSASSPRPPLTTAIVVITSSVVKLFLLLAGEYDDHSRRKDCGWSAYGTEREFSSVYDSSVAALNRYLQYFRWLCHRLA